MIIIEPENVQNGNGSLDDLYLLFTAPAELYAHAQFLFIRADQEEACLPSSGPEILPQI